MIVFSYVYAMQRRRRRDNREFLSVPNADVGFPFFIPDRRRVCRSDSRSVRRLPERLGRRYARTEKLINGTEPRGKNF